ncbi:MAG: hypothetical protein LUC17_02665 [Oscillospiraceae bacterium]|nr:hypothetical protein [Oscillospiraceae bacterium]
MAIEDLDASLVTVGQPVEGGACFACFDTEPTFPTDATTAMSSIDGWESAGELTEDGYTEGKSITSNDLKGWHGKTLLVTTEDTTNTFQCSFVEVDRGTAAKLRYGQSNVDVDSDGVVTKIEDKSINNDEVALVFDELESNNSLRRTIVKRARVTSMDDVPHQRGSLMVYGMTFTSLEPKDDSAAIEIYHETPDKA